MTEPGPQPDQAARHWGDERRLEYYGQGGIMWDQLAAVRRRLNQRISGQPDRDWVDHLGATWLAGRLPVANCLSLCCGEGIIERELAARSVFQHCDARDVSPGALEAARALARDAGYQHITYHQADINRIELPAGRYDLVIAHRALHHLDALEHVADQIHASLAPGGLLVTEEYVGPRRCEHPPDHWDRCDAALRLLPERFRRSVGFQRWGRVGAGAARGPADWCRLLRMKLANGRLWEALRRKAAQVILRRAGAPLVKQSVARIVGRELAVDDPSEAVRSDDILPVLAARFEFLQQTPLGGALLTSVLDDIAGNFETGDPAAEPLLGMLFAIEDSLMEAGEMGSDFVFVVAGRRA